MSVQPTTSFVSGSSVLIHQPGLVLSQPVVPEPLETIMLDHHAASGRQSFVRSQPTPQPGVVLSQPSIAPIDLPQLVLPASTEIAVESRQAAVSDGMPLTLMEQHAIPLFKQADQGSKMDGETHTSDVSLLHIPPGSELAVLQSAQGKQDSVSACEETNI